MILKVKFKDTIRFSGKMSNRGFYNSPRGYSPGYSPYNSANRSYGNGQNHSGQPYAWGSPAQSSSCPPQNSFSYPNRRPSMSPRHQQFSPRHHSFNDSFTPSNRKMSSPKDHHFKTPDYVPFASPSSGGNRGRGSGRKSYKTFQNPRKDNSCNPGGSQNIEDYYHPEMLQDPWKYCTPVPV